MNIAKLKIVLAEPEQRKFLFMRAAGNFLVLLALFGVVLTFAPAVAGEINYRLERAGGVAYRVVGGEIVRTYPTSGRNPLARLLQAGRPSRERIAPASTDFGIVIPKIGANARVIANVDAGDERSYRRALLAGVAHARGTGFPGAPDKTYPGNNNRKIYLFAHSTDNWWNVSRYNAVFFLLKELRRGDEIDLFYQGRRFIYRTSEKRIVGADAVRYLVEPAAEEVLVLQTCWPPGTTLKRLLIIARPQRQLNGRLNPNT